jgi:6-phosphogluconolactonase/glucosamine-6-phosphate isomerase/deaminase
VTLTYPVLNNSRVAIFVTTGDGKKDIIEVVLV